MHPAICLASIYFGPGITFRVWQGQIHADICVCCFCSGWMLQQGMPSTKWYLIPKQAEVFAACTSGTEPAGFAWG